MHVIFGYTHLAGESCPSCGGNYMMAEDEGDPDFVRIRCWCGGNGTVKRNDPDFIRHQESHGIPHRDRG